MIASKIVLIQPTSCLKSFHRSIQIFAPKFIYHEGSATVSSEQIIRSFYDSNLATYPDFKFTLEDVIAEGNKVAIRVIFEGTHKTYGKKIRFVDHWIGRVMVENSWKLGKSLTR